MPSTAKSKTKNSNGTIKSNCAPKKSSDKKLSKNGNETKKAVKDLVVETAKETVTEVLHRKSERRRIARDIFLVFEEESNSRKKTRGTNKKHTKPKFGHLKVEDHIKPKGLLRDIKNEPRCYLNGNSLSVNTSVPSVPILKCNSNALSISNEEKNTKSEKIKAVSCKSANSNFSNNIKSFKETQYCTIDNASIAARVNPIFLWVKQDDTRIVEVRCEDYDKRNRIRITKTTNGWRAIPRSDPTSSRVLKFYPTPLMKVKREIISESNNIINSHMENNSVVCNNILSINVNEIDKQIKQFDSKYNSLPPKSDKTKKKKSKKKYSEKIPSKSKINTITTQTNISIDSLNTLVNKNTSDETCSIYNNVRFESKNIEQGSTYQKHLEILEKKPTDVNTLLITEPTYQKESFHLCPETGFFLPSNDASISDHNSENYTQSENNGNDIIINKNSFDLNKGETAGLEKNIEPKIQINEENTESLEAKTRNLKDLLDDDNLLQHCDDNANSDAELIDTLVKTSCENNLIQANEILTKVSMDHFQQKSLHGDNEMVVQLITEVSDPPKCLSFNEAGEIEGLNGELFQPNTFIETFEKQSSNISSDQQITLHSTTSVAAMPASPQRRSTSNNIEPIMEIVDSDKIESINVLDDSPKDLSYKKREEICPPSESRSQCAVTSSSDIIKSPQQENASLTSTSETLKNLILEQFIKLNAISSQNQRNPVDLGKQKHADISNIKSLYTSNSMRSNDFIETVVIEDDEDDNGGENEHEEGPLKKRLRINNQKSVNQNLAKISMIDKDPDPLTQLRLLIRNTQWKVPDPILVPKDRLSAVLASPAREIPLLITTRPELRLPEAFAYPEIIQNPNILVISMAQLEAILRNEHENQEISKVMDPEVNPQISEEENISMQLSEHLTTLQSQPTKQYHLQHQTKIPTNISTNSTNQIVNNQLTSGTSEISSEKVNENIKCSQMDSSLSSDINSSTLAMLNQMLWLPYFGKFSQDIAKSFNSPILLHEKLSNLFPTLNSHLNCLTSIDDVYKNKISGQPAFHNDFKSFQQKLGTTEELSIFQKIVQGQMQSVLQLNQLKTDSSRFSDPDNDVTTIDNPKSNNIESLPNFSINKNQLNNCKNLLVAEKSYNLRSSVAGRQFSDTKQYSSNIQRRNAGNKPRLTCKSLSNLLDPEHGMAPTSSSSVSCGQHLPSEFHDIKRNTTECNSSLKKFDGMEKHLRDTINVLPPARSSSNTNITIESSSEFNKHKAKTFVDSIRAENNSSNNDMSGISADTNIPLWHPLFGSNTKTAYSSPWQWTTVTATGE